MLFEHATLLQRRDQALKNLSKRGVMMWRLWANAQLNNDVAVFGGGRREEEHLLRRRQLSDLLDGAAAK